MTSQVSYIAVYDLRTDATIVPHERGSYEPVRHLTSLLSCHAPLRYCAYSVLYDSRDGTVCLVMLCLASVP